jgi:hypothetical protein
LDSDIKANISVNNIEGKENVKASKAAISAA